MNENFLLHGHCPVVANDRQIVSALGLPIAVATDHESAVAISLLLNTGANRVLKRRRAMRARRLRQAEKDRRESSAPIPQDMLAEMFGI